MKITLFILTLSLIISCTKQENSVQTEPHNHRFVVEDVIQTTSYTYLLAKEDNNSQWLALPKIEAAIGDVYYREDGMEMKDFNSKELDRTFSSVLFLKQVRTDTYKEEPVPENHSKPVNLKQDVTIKRVEGTITIEELFTNSNTYSNEMVKIQGKVVKFSANIMGKNWIHIQDGTEYEGKNDLTVTSEQRARVGETIIIKGKISIDKDFGSGYFYDVIMENGEVIE